MMAWPADRNSRSSALGSGTLDDSFATEDLAAVATPTSTPNGSNTSNTVGKTEDDNGGGAPRSRKKFFRKLDSASLKSANNSRYRIPTVTLISVALNFTLLLVLLCTSFAWSSGADWLGESWFYVFLIFASSSVISYGITETFESFYGVAYRLIKGSTKGRTSDIVLVAIQCFINLLVSFALMKVAFSPCFSCAKFYRTTDIAGGGFVNSFLSKDDKHGAWRLLMGPENGVDADPANVVCRACLGWLVRSFSFHWSSADTNGDEEPPNEVHSRHELISWYNDFSVKESKKYMKSSTKRMFEGLAADGKFTDQDLYDILNDILCSPMSRVDNPDPVQFLASLETPKFTGEDIENGTSLNISPHELQSIMRGDMLRKLGPTVCFMLRFSLFIEEDTTSEKAPISSVLDIKSLLNEQDMRAQDGAFDLPGTVIAGLDPDFDIDSKQMDAIKTAIDIFTRLDYEDDPKYFDTKEQYLAFFRWTLENIIQEEWYFPRWLNDLTDGDDYASLLAEQKVLSPHLTTLIDPQSDKTLGDRAFYGTGQKFLTAVKLPGDVDYEFYFPGNPHFYITRNHTEFYRCPNKPTAEDLLKMVQGFGPTSKRVSNGASCPVDSLQRLRSRIVEIDLSPWSKLPGRDQFDSVGAILYLDSKTKMPMGIWKTSRTQEQENGQMFLPDAGRDWEHAKFAYRTVERMVLASIHVHESHLSWSHAVSVATMQTLPPKHCLAALLKPFTYGAHLVNNAAYHMLVREHSILTHSSGLIDQTKPLLFFGHHIDFSETIPDALESKRLGNGLKKDMPLFTQGLKLYDAHYDFVKNFIHLLYVSDEAMASDETLARFWHHVNSFGRHHDPCVCHMESDLFFDGNNVWPGFESTRTCEDLLSSANFHAAKNIITRRLEWCNQDVHFRIKALRQMLEEECKADVKCNALRFEFEHMRLDMGLKPLATRKQLVDFLSTFVWHVTVGHRFNGDNVPYLTDPEHTGVRMRATDKNGELPLITDIATYVFGVTVGALTTVKSNGLLADWTPIYHYLAELQTDLSQEERQDLFRKLDDIHRTYKRKLLKLSREFLRESSSRPKNRQSNVFNPASQSSSVSV